MCQCGYSELFVKKKQRYAVGKQRNHRNTFLIRNKRVNALKLVFTHNTVSEIVLCHGMNNIFVNLF